VARAVSKFQCVVKCRPPLAANATSSFATEIAHFPTLPHNILLLHSLIQVENFRDLFWVILFYRQEISPVESLGDLGYRDSRC